MLYLLFLFISFGAFLGTLMPATGTGIIVTAVVFVLGVGLILFTKAHKVASQCKKSYSLMVAAILAAASFSGIFYGRWLPSSKVQSIAAMLHLSTEALLLIGAAILWLLAVYFIYTALQLIKKGLSCSVMQNPRVIGLLHSFIAAFLTVMVVQVMTEVSIWYMGPIKLMANTLIVWAIILLLYCAIGRIMPCVSIGSGIFILLASVNVYVYHFRGRLFAPSDILAAGTAMNVAGNYSLFPLPRGMLIGWSFFVAMLLVFSCLQPKSRPKLTVKKRCILLAFSVISLVATFFYAINLQAYHWQKCGAQFSGYILNFATKFKEITVQQPDHYSVDQIAKLADQYSGEADATRQPHIIVIMNEAFSDLEVIGSLDTNTEVTPFISSLKENTVSGYALTSIYGGNTCNSEYEFLTGNSMAWLSPNAVPYSQYIRSSTYSMVSHLKQSYNYKCIAMHPYYSSGWSRPSTYGYLGFDACHFLEDFPQEDLIRNYVSDREMFEFLIETYEAQKADPLFIFGVTMQNHGDYNYTGDNFTQHISLGDVGNQYPEVEQYLSLLHETDKAVAYLIEYFENVNEDVIIVFYGDHQPRLNEAFHETISGTTASTLEEQQKRFQVPFFIWANYDIEEEYVDCVSLNYLSSYVYEAAGMTLPPYNQFLQELEANIPAINANGFYSPAAGTYLSFQEASEEERYWLEAYEALQYNCLFDKKNRSEILFPTLEN